LDDIIPDLISLKYKINLQDHRNVKIIPPEPITSDFFSHITTKSGDSWVMRDYQVDMVNALISNSGGVGIGGTGAGKAHPLYTNILTSNGWVLMKNIKVGDYVITPINGFSRVNAIHPQGITDVYEVEFEDGVISRCTLEHLWKITNFLNGTTEVITTEQILDMMIDGISCSIPTCYPISFYDDCLYDFAINPHFLGYFIANKAIRRSADKKFIDLLCQMGLYACEEEDLFIPFEYKNAKVHERTELLTGLLTNNHHVVDGLLCYYTYSKQLSNDIQYIVNSLGGLCKIVKQENGKYCCHLSYKNIESIGQQSDYRVIKHIKYVGREETQCISVDDPQGLYLIDNFVVTHNTSMTAALSRAYELSGGYKSIIIVPDTNLTNQTKTEYEFFGLDVGEYSGSNKDIDHQHVVSTWQALNNNPMVMSNRQLVIVDECHNLRGQTILKLLTEHASHIPLRFGVTGTLPKSETDKLSVKIAVGSVCYEIPAHALIKDGWLSTVKIEAIQTVIDFHEEYNEFIVKNKQNMFKVPTYNKFKNEYFPDYAAEKAFLNVYKKRMDWIVEFIKEKRKDGNVLCLVNNIPQGKKLTKLIENSYFLSRDLSIAKRKELYDMFETKDDMVLFSTAQLAGTGLNIPRIFILIYIDIGKSFIRTIQTIGRGLRKAEDKNHIKIYDICADLKYGKSHLLERIKYYTEAKYPFEKVIVDNYPDDGL
jgi:superfamily II DNA or RNA helicase